MEHRGVELGSCLQSTRREWDITRPEWDTKNLKACDFRKPLRRFRRYQSQNGSRHFSTDHPVDGLRLTVAQLDFRGPRCHDRGPDITARCRIPVIYRNDLTAQIGYRP